METNYPLQIWVYTFCYNEEQILPYVIEYWKQYATKVVVYDNGSTDKSVEILKKYDWIEVRTYDTNNTFDPEKIQQYKSICYHEADGKADYVMVCDIDEVLLVNENLFPELILAKKDGTKLFQTKYYELINLTSSTDKEILIHNSVGYYGYHNTKIYKAILFDPSIKLCFSNYSLSYVTDIDYKTQSIATVHLKLMSSQLLFKRQSQLYSRLNKNCKYPDNALFYGTKQNVGTRISYIKLIMPYKCKFSKTEKYITVTNDVNNKSDGFIKFNELTWMPTEIQYKDKNKRLDCIIGVPVYKSDLTSNEEASFNQLCKIIENNYEICLICPADIDLTKYNEISEKYNIKLSVLFCAKQYFKGTACYSYLCETADFYECFKEYEYLLIYQLDGWIFKNNLDYFINLNVDYIGSPWKLGSFNFNSNAVGNGGVSLRRVEKFIQVCKQINPINCASKYINKEDLFFCKIMRQKTNLHIATVKEASKFSVTAFSEYFIKTYNNGELPMCVHSWSKEWDFWKKYIDVNNDQYLQPPPMNKQIQPVKNDYKTRLELIKLKLAKNNNQIKPIIIKEQQKELKEQKPAMDIYTDLLKSYYGIKDKESTKVSTNIVSEYLDEIKADKQGQKNIEIKEIVLNPEIKKETNIQKLHFENKSLAFICEGISDKDVSVSNYERIIITLTSWVKRVKNLHHIIELLMNNTKQPDIININLAIEEFPNKEQDLPEDLQNDIKNNSKVKITWLNNNTKVWKKLIPTIYMYPNDIIIPMDDDFEYPNNFIQDLYEEYLKYGKKCPISANRAYFFGMHCHCGCASVTKKEFIEPYFYILNDNIIKAGSDDIFYSYCAKKNNKEYVFSRVQFTTNKMPAYQANNAYSTGPGASCDITKTFRECEIAFRNTHKPITNNIKNINFLNNIYNNKNIQIVYNFDINNYNIEKMFCILGVLKSCKGLQLQKDMIGWLSTKYNVISIIQEYPGELYEYPAINYAKQFSSINNCNILYLHTKGAYNSNIWQNMVLDLWQDEFINHYDDYLKILNNDKNIIACPFTGTTKWTWFNGFYISYNASKQMKEIEIVKDRHEYETIFQYQPNIQVIGRIYNNIDNFKNSNNKTKLLMREYIIKNYNKNNISINKYFDNNYVLHNNRIIVTMTSYPGRINNVAISIQLLLTKQTIKPDEIHLWLSIEEFPNKENSLPKQLVKVINENDDVYLHWLEKNIYVHKRHEIFKYTTDSDYVFLIDDDVEYDPKLIETVLEKAKTYPNTIITYNKYAFHEYKGRTILYRDNRGEPGPFINKTRWCGQSMIPSAIYPKEILSDENQKIRNNTSPVSDECWFQPWTIYYDIPIYECSFDWGKDIDKNNTKWQGLVAWSHQKEANGYTRRDNWLYAVLKSYPSIYKKYQDLFNYDK